MAHNHEQLERAHSICSASHQRIIAAIEFPLAAHELLFSPHIFIRVDLIQNLEYGETYCLRNENQVVHKFVGNIAVYSYLLI